jgi:hypothetical protein
VRSQEHKQRQFPVVGNCENAVDFNLRRAAKPLGGVATAHGENPHEVIIISERSLLKGESIALTKKNEDRPTENRAGRYAISLDTWAVALALFVSLLIRFGLIKTIPW